MFQDAEHVLVGCVINVYDDLAAFSLRDSFNSFGKMLRYGTVLMRRTETTVVDISQSDISYWFIFCTKSCCKNVPYHIY